MSKESEKGSNFLIKESTSSMKLEKEKAFKITFFLSSIREKQHENFYQYQYLRKT